MKEMVRAAGLAPAVFVYRVPSSVGSLLPYALTWWGLERSHLRLKGFSLPLLCLS